MSTRGCIEKKEDGELGVAQEKKSSASMINIPHQLVNLNPNIHDHEQKCKDIKDTDQIDILSFIDNEFKFNEKVIDDDTSTHNNYGIGDLEESIEKLRSLLEEKQSDSVRYSQSETDNKDLKRYHSKYH